MLKFVVQTDKNGKILHDFSEGLKKCQEFYEWLSAPYNNPEDKNEIVIDYVDYDGLEDYVKWRTDVENYTPCGSVEFVKAFAKYVFKTDYFPRPLNVPDELIDTLYTGRICKNLNTEDEVKEFLERIKIVNPQYPNRFFVKSIDTIKDKYNGFYDVIKDTKNGYKTCECRMHEGNPVKKIFEEEALKVFVGKQVSTILPDIISEWRIFMYKGQPLDIKNYDGDPFGFPNRNRIYEFIDQYKNYPEAYTLDIAVTENGTWVMECHDFYSCGLYGCSNKNIPYMMNHSWFHIKQDILAHKNEKNNV